MIKFSSYICTKQCFTLHSPTPTPTPTPSTRKPTKTQQMTEASALVCLILTTALVHVFVVCLTDV